MGITLKNNKSVTKNMTIKGDDGIGIKTITSGTPVVTEEKTTTPITVTLTDETTQNFNVEAQNGSSADNALTKPATAPSATQIVAVDNTNSQKMLNIGNGLSVENGSLKASGGKLYYKRIQLQFLAYFEALEGTMSINIYFYESNNTLYNIDNIGTLYQKIPFAICNNESDPQNPNSPVWIFGCKINTTDFTFSCLTKDGHFKEVQVLFSSINNSDIMLTCNNIEV